MTFENAQFKVDRDTLSDLVSSKSQKLLGELGGIEGVCKLLKVSASKGLNSDETSEKETSSCEQFGTISSRKAQFGCNVLPCAPVKSLWSLVWDAYQDQTLIMLSIASLVSLVVGIYEDSLKDPSSLEPRVGWVEGVAIQIAVLVVVLTGSINDYQKENQFRALNAKKSDRKVRVIRNGEIQEISIFQIVVGDIVDLEPGEIVPVDGLLLESHSLVCDESSATGESDSVKKGKNDPFFLSGSKVLEGVGKILTVAVGESSFSGRILMALREDSCEPTPLQAKLTILADLISQFGLVSAVLMALTLLGQFGYFYYTGSIQANSAEVFSTVVHILIQAITVVVVAVPEGLPMAVMLALAYATTEMIKDNNLVRILASCETMGNATVLCSDKTGTLTQNIMTVVKGVISQHSLESPESLKKSLPLSSFEQLCKIISCNSTAFEGPDGCMIGSKTEGALIKLIQSMEQNYRTFRTKYEVVLRKPFSSEVKSMTTIIKSQTEYQALTTGASEIILDASTHYLDSNGVVCEMDSTARSNFKDIISSYSNDALRTIGLGYRNIEHFTLKSCGEQVSEFVCDLILVGIVGLEDPLRSGVPASILQCRQAGVQVKMITGDNAATAAAIARKAGILTPGGLVISGPEFRALSEKELETTVPRMQVLARSSPVDKQIVVRTLQKLGEVVAMTGDGANDGPALKLANVGFSMGITGTEVAKEASDIILMDDNFSSIIRGLVWGRSVNMSVRKFLQFQLTVNITAVVLSFYSAVVDPNHHSVLSAVQLLWVNLIMDTLAALALATEPPTSDLLSTPPPARNSSLISSSMWKHIVGQSAFQIIISSWLIKHGSWVFDSTDPVVQSTCIFNTFVFLQIFNEFNCRRIQNEFNVFADIMNNSIFLLIQLLVVLGQIAIVEFGGVAFSTVSLNSNQWYTSVFIGALSLPLGLVLRIIASCSPDDTQYHTPIVSYHQLEQDTLSAKKSSPSSLSGIRQRRVTKN